MKTILIAAVDQNLALGVSGNLLFRIPEDLKLFKRLTTGHIVLMGRKTFESLGCKPLPDRVNIVISTTKKYDDGVITFESLTTAVEYSKLNYPDKDLYIIGGGKVYRQCTGLADEVILTEYGKAYEEADTYFPDEIKKGFRETETILEGSFDGAGFKTCVYTKIT
jgi:dihydrofolate reductase